MTVLPVALALLALSLVDVGNAERVLGAYIFQRHGDRTAKALAPTELTDLGYTEEYKSGNFFNNRYISSSSAYQIEGISPKIVNLNQIAASAPEDNVIQNSGQAFLQGLYPPVGSAANQTLRNGSTIYSPLNGYQLIPMAEVNSGSDSEDNTWLQSTSACANAEVSSNNYFYSAAYKELLSSTKTLYQSLAPLVGSIMKVSQLNYKNAYTIWDLFNVASIHNSTATTLPSNQEMQQLFVLANTHEYNLAYSSNDTMRAVAGMTLAGQIVSALNKTITSGGASKLNVQFGAYSTFLSYFGLAGLAAENVNFTGMPNYASSMAWELVTNATGTGMPSQSDLSVRFVFHNGTSIAGSTQLQTYPLFRQSVTTLPWTQFVSNMNKFAITTQEQWCHSCGNTTGICSSSSSAASTPSSSPSSSGGLSLGDAGVIGAMVTLGVLAGLTALIMLVFGLRLVRKSTLAAFSRSSETPVTGPTVKRPSA
ncbi:uncharacterized protein N7498_002433 [Penicillium cinerascens]|uniref:Uncharacterized protein n=1 Tax=Penicillium cinerascens TaxID=70096 RepID=A0A9W9NA09_9EURO|nr:uncharacterized protein N7498_002433 [Penicillium cinerascens]KAJ5216026.1 hypothetical protein N7498_002433 [Penicillium cinerascens]